MATEQEELRWKLYNKKSDLLYKYGVRHNLISTYDDKLLDKLRHVYYGGLPASIILLHNNLSNGFCYDRGPLITLGFDEDDDFKVVDADVDSLRLNPKYIDETREGKQSERYANHCFAERILKDGRTLVYDTSLGLVFDKKLYYRLENPKITKINDKETTLEFLYYDSQRDSNIETDKYTLPFLLPTIERNLEPIQLLYSEQLKEEIELFKKEINYESICEEVQNEIKVKKLLKRKTNKI